MGSTAHDAQFNRTTIYVSLGLAVALVRISLDTRLREKVAA